MNFEIFTSKGINLINEFPLYINENGIGPSEEEIGNEFNLSLEKVKLAINSYAFNE